jgi:hypothetical protein
MSAQLTKSEVLALKGKLAAEYASDPEMGQMVYDAMMRQAVPDPEPAPLPADKPKKEPTMKPDERIEALRLTGLSRIEATARAAAMDAEDSLASSTAAMAQDEADFAKAHPGRPYDPWTDWRATDAYAAMTDAERAAALAKSTGEAFGAGQVKYDHAAAVADAAKADAESSRVAREGAARQALLDSGLSMEQVDKAIPVGSLRGSAAATPESVKMLAEWRAEQGK